VTQTVESGELVRVVRDVNSAYVGRIGKIADRDGTLCAVRLPERVELFVASQLESLAS
jgi:RNase P/RNase MRP subunit p29